MNKRTVAIIGGGVSGLTAGIYALKYGFDATIFERNTSVGGLCTGWSRRGTYIDGCIHWLTESNRGVLNKLWHETGAIDENTKIYHYDIYSQSVYNGREVNFYTDCDKLEEELLSHAETKNDRKWMKTFVKAVRKCDHNALTVEKPFHLWKFIDTVKFIWKILPIMSVIKTFGKLSIKDFGNKLDSKDLKFCFANTLVPDGYSLFSLMSTFGGIASKNSGIAIGGSKALVERMKEKFIEMGGEIKYRTDVEKIAVENDTAKGVTLTDGSTFKFDYVIPACDLHHVLVDLLDDKYHVPALDERDELKAANPTYSMIMLSFRTKKDLSGIVHNRYVHCRDFETLGRTYDVIYFKHFGYDKTLIEDGYTVVQAILTTDEAQYNRLQAMSKEQYKEFKKDLGEQLQQLIVETEGDRYGELELLAIVTPMTFTHYVNAYNGTFMTYMLTKDSRQMILRNNVLPVKNIAMAGHWMMVPGGVPIAAMQGKFAAQTIANQEGIKS